MDLSIIIISYNTKEVTDHCLQSVFDASWRSTFEVIVVDNNSTDGSVDMIKRKYPVVRLISNESNRLFSIANNQGAAIARGKYLLLLNSDTQLSGDNMQRLVDHFETLPDEVACLGPKVLNVDGTTQSVGFPQYGLRAMVFKHFLRHVVPSRWIVGRLARILAAPCDEERRVGYVSGCCMLLRREQFLKAGCLNENIEFYGEELELGYRLKKKFGMSTVYWPGAEIVHLGGMSTPKKTDRVTSCRRYGKLVLQTIGSDKAVAISDLTIVSYFLKLIFAKDKAVFREMISYEKEVRKYLKTLKV